MDNDREDRGRRGDRDHDPHRRRPGTAMLATGDFFPRGTVGVLGVALAFGFSLLVAAYAIGSISGCHINPAVTLGLWVIGKTKTRELPFYIVGQVVGGLIGALVIYIIANGSACRSARRHRASPPTGTASTPPAVSSSAR